MRDTLDDALGFTEYTDGWGRLLNSALDAAHFRAAC